MRAPLGHIEHQRGIGEHDRVPAGELFHDGGAGFLALAVIAPVWGYSWVVIKVALDYARPFTYIALVTVLCTACFFLALVVSRRSLRPPPLLWVASIGLQILLPILIVLFYFDDLSTFLPTWTHPILVGISWSLAFLAARRFRSAARVR